MTTETFTVKSNARRAARRMIEKGVAPASEFSIAGGDGRFEIVWGNPASASTEQVEAAAAAPRPLLADAEIAAAAAVEPAAEHEPARSRAPHNPSRTGSRVQFAGGEVEPGRLPQKPVLTAASFTASYQKRIDHLAERAAAGEWAAVEAYEIKGHNTYSKIVARYRAQLLAARPQAEVAAA